MEHTSAGGTNTKPSSFLIVYFLLKSLLVTHSGEETSQPESDQVAVTDSRPPPLADDALAKVNLPRKLPSIIEIKKAIPQNCFESNTLLSVYYMIKDFLLVSLFYVLVEWTWEVFPPVVQLVITPIFWLVQGTMFTAIFVAGHDAGHGSFSNSELINTFSGNICHTFLFCPYYMWKEQLCTRPHFTIQTVYRELVAPGNKYKRCFGYDGLSEGPPSKPPPFLPERVPGLQLSGVRTRENTKQFLRPIDFFKLYFIADIVGYLCQFTNEYAQQHGPNKPTGWYDVTPEEFYRFCALLMYAGLVPAPSIDRLWSRKGLYNGLWARA